MTDKHPHTELERLREEVRHLRQRLAQSSAAAQTFSVRTQAGMSLPDGLTNTVLERVTDAVLVVDADGRIHDENAQAARLLGQAPDVLLGKTDWQAWPASVRPLVEQQCRRSLHEQVAVYFECHCQEEGQSAWLAISAYPAQADLLLICQDIRARKQSETGQALLAAIVSSSEDAIVSKDLDGIVTSWNDAAARIYGWKAHEIIGRSKALVIPPTLPDELAGILRRVRAGERVAEYETQRVHKDGHFNGTHASAATVGTFSPFLPLLCPASYHETGLPNLCTTSMFSR